MPAHMVDGGGDTKMEDAAQKDAGTVSLKDPSGADTSDSEEPRPDPDAQTTVTDFLDFTEYLPSDTMRSLALIGNLDRTYADASSHVHDLTKQWGMLPSLPSNERPSPVRLRADISEQLSQAVSSRVFAHAEAVRMSESVHRHYNKAKLLLSKLQTMMDNYPTEEEQQKSPVAPRSPQATRKLTAKASREGGQRRKPRIPKITVPGEVLAPYDIEYDTFTDGSDDSSEDEDDIPAAGRRTPAPTPRIKLVASSKTPKSASRATRPAQQTTAPSAEEIAAHAAALLRPPPENAVIGSPDAPWLQLTEYELAKLRKRMKKNATWTPSETMVARELRTLGRGPEDFKEAKKKAEEEGKTFEAVVPALVADDGSGAQQLPAGAISADSVAAEEVPTSNRGMKLNEAKKLKREALAKLAAEEAEESARKTAAAAKLFLGGSGGASGSPSDDTQEAPKPAKVRNGSRSNPKRKRDLEGERGSEAPEGDETPSARPRIKRAKTETPVPPPQLGKLGQNSVARIEASTSRAQVTPRGNTSTTRTETPVPVPLPLQSSTSSGSVRVAKSPTPNAATANSQTVTTSVPIKPPATETPVPVPRSEGRTSTTPILPPTRELPARESTKRETRGDAAKRTNPQTEASDPNQQSVEQDTGRRSLSRGPNPATTTPAAESSSTRRPGSRGKTWSQEPQPSLANERPRRTSTARNTPAPEVRPPSRRTKRPAPGIVSTTSSGGSAAVGKRKAAPRKKARDTRREKDQSAEAEMEEVDDEGNPIDPDEPRYCLCNRVSFGTMIQCDNIDDNQVVLP
ncbi:hypothetical protein ACO1O0_001340 [Amphichorda felina]